MAAEEFTLFGAPFERSASSNAAAVSRIVKWDWPEPKPKLVGVETPEGSIQLDDADYEDRTVTIELETTNAAGELGTRPWVQLWEQVAAAATRDKAARLESTFSDGTVLTFDVLTAHFAADLGHEHWVGYGGGTLTLQCRPAGSVPPANIAGTLDGAVWTADDTIGGDFPMLASVDVEWMSSRKQAVVQVVDAEPLVAPCAAAEGADTSVVALPGSVWWPAAQALDALLPVAPEMVLPLVDAGSVLIPDGVYDVDVRVALPVFYASATLVLLVDGVEASRANVDPSGRFRSLFPSDDVVAWQLVPLGRVTLHEGARVTVGYQSSPGDTVLRAYFDYVSLARVSASARLTTPEPQRGVVIGSIPSGGGIGSPDGDATTYGAGAIEATGWVQDPAGPVTWANYPTGTGTLRLVPTLPGDSELPLVASARLKWADASELAGSLYLTVDDYTKYISVIPVLGQLAIKVHWDGGESFYQTTNYPIADGQWVDVAIGLDEGGRWFVDAGPGNGTLQRIRTGTDPQLEASVPEDWFAELAVYSSDAGQLAAQSLFLRRWTPGSTNSTWSANSPQTVKGNLPTFTPGETPRLHLRAGGDRSDAQLDHDPVSVSVTGVARYLQVPNG